MNGAAYLQMPRNRDLFDDSTMTFGEHLEALRVHVWKALVGMIFGVIICLFVGNHIVGFLRQPIDDALRRNNMPTAKDDLGGMDFAGFLKQLFSGEEKKEEVVPEINEPAIDELQVEVPLQSLVAAIEAVAPGTVKSPPAVPAATNAADAESDNGEEQGEDVAAQPVTIPLVLKAPEFELFRKTADRFNRPVALKVEEAFLTYIKVSLVAGFALTSPWIFYQIWLFVAAGLFPHERKYVYTYLPMSLGLFLVGGLFCFYLVMPIVLDFLISFNKWIGVELQPRLSEYISFVLMLPVMFGISFQLPLVMLFLERIGIVSVEGYTENWRMAVLVISIVSMLLTPSDPQSMLLMMFPLIFLYIGGIQLCRFNPSKQVDPLA